MDPDDRGGDPLTAAEREALHAALDVGYFTASRHVTLGDVADELDLPESEASDRLRRAMTKTFRDHRETFEAELGGDERGPLVR